MTTAIEKTATLCARLGHDVIPVEHPLAGDGKISNAFIALVASDAAALVDIAVKMGRDPASVLEPWTLGTAALFDSLPQNAIEEAMAVRMDTIRKIDAFFARYDAWLTPMLDRPPPKLGEFSPEVPFATLRERSMGYVSYTSFHNFVGTPAMSVPLDWNQAGLPIGSQFSAARGGERTLFELAYELEAANPGPINIRPYSRDNRGL